MKKQITALITAALILANFTACSSSNDPINASLENMSNISDNSDNKIENSSSIDNSEIIDPEPPKPELSEESKKLLSQIEIQSFVGPDGETVQAADAADVFDTRATHRGRQPRI